MAAMDITGEVFGRLTALRIDEERTTRGRGGKIVWQCRCECGAISYVQTNNLRSGSSTTCGGAVHKSIPDGDPALYRSVFERYKKSAASRGLNFELSRAQFIGIITQPCHYCGVEGFRAPLRSGSSLGRRRINGVDRRDSSEGYIMGNCLPCCHRCNEMKMDENYEEFLTRMAKILMNLGRI